MEPGLNCSDLCDSDSTVSSQVRRPSSLPELCTVTITTSAGSGKISPFPSSSAALLGIVWMFLTSGVLLALFFLAFTIRFRNNRIVKMSSPNLNIVTLLGSSFTYVSAYLFGMQEQDLFPGTSMEVLVQVRLCLLCVGTSLVLGPVLGKTWRLYRVFTQRVPDKRVIIKDLQLLVMVAVLVLADAILLLTWVFSDPVQCFRSLSASMRATEKGVTCSVSRMQFCASLYSDLWLVLILGFKGILLICGTYLAGLTDNVSSPPVNQSLTLIVSVNLVFLTTGTVLLANRFFYTWPNLVFGFTSGGIFVCTTTINCFVFVPQLRHWKSFEEEESQTINHMAKYFNSPSKSFLSMYSEEQIYQLIGEKNSMRRLLTEKNAVIESLQEQVNNAKEKLMKLMSADCGYDPMHPALPSTSLSLSLQNTNHHVKPSGCDMDAEEPLGDHIPPGQEAGSWQCSSPPHPQCSPVSLSKEDCAGDTQDHNSYTSHHCTPPEDPACSLIQPCDSVGISEYNSNRLQEKWVPQSSKKIPGSLLGPRSQSPAAAGEGAAQAENSAMMKEQPLKFNYVSSEKLQEILQELSLGSMVGAQASPWGSRQARHSAQQERRSVWRSQEKNLSPYMTWRRRRIPLHSPPPSYPGSASPLVWCVVNQTVGRAAAGQGCDEVACVPRAKAGDHSDGRCLGQTSSSSPADNGQDQPEQHNHVSSKHPGLDQAKNCSTLRHPLHTPLQEEDALRELRRPLMPSLYCYPDSDSSSSSEEVFHCCHRPYCEICFQDPCVSSDSSVTDTDPEPGEPLTLRTKLYGRSQPVVNFKEDLTPTFV
ncbi:probable G-protein coupled receptor 156 isoform X1 [Alligator mississippiensis]|uniref:probable G-protein coupled receptor 156 isoform X1 n=1 Tax=Alligator mississippiensis TaxID=8496 RepID=UPI002877F292|nr:probable G-protein coupled receptor 156 isoform X1 [Alligator mississippiensis]